MTVNSPVQFLASCLINEVLELTWRLQSNFGESVYFIRANTCHSRVNDRKAKCFHFKSKWSSESEVVPPLSLNRVESWTWDYVYSRIFSKVEWAELLEGCYSAGCHSHGGCYPTGWAAAGQPAVSLTRHLSGQPAQGGCTEQPEMFKKSENYEPAERTSMRF